jgi:antitoxin MazE
MGILWAIFCAAFLSEAVYTHCIDAIAQSNHGRQTVIVKIQKWGNSLGLRIPKALAANIVVSEGADVDLSIEDGRLIVSPQQRKPISIDELVEGITDENLHSETDTGSVVGREVW